MLAAEEKFMPEGEDCCTPSVGIEGEVNSAKMHTTRTRDQKRTKMTYSKSLASTEHLKMRQSSNFHSTITDRYDKKTSG